jgi:hypothetical protein
METQGGEVKTDGIGNLAQKWPLRKPMPQPCPAIWICRNRLILCFLR